MTSITTLGYGLTVRATDLLTAAQAWPRIEPTFRFLDLILRRKAKGTLASRGKMEGLVELVPVEVWQAISEWAVMLEMEEQEDKFLDQHSELCDDLSDFYSRVQGKISWDYLRRKGVPDYFYEGEFQETLESLEDGDDIVYEVRSNFDSSNRRTKKRKTDLFFEQLIRRLVAAFGLSHPLERIIAFDSTDIYRVFTSIALITIPAEIKRENSTYTTVLEQGDFDDEADQHDLIDVSLDLPSNANLRFFRFVRTFNLTVLEANNGTLQCVASKPRRNPKPGGRMSGIQRKRVRIVKEIKPRWRLYTTYYHDL
ncbi:uncharacterized protein JCM6883_004420 [Sporobolomyces salmoneus]|uniref:uncharacterized protein n=1 Tax=Sporobolomyces salmoneus TaxID=183962 RepID=UPI00316E4130